MSSVNCLSNNLYDYNLRSRKMKSLSPVSYQTVKDSGIFNRSLFIKIGILIIIIAAAVILLTSFISPTQAEESVHSVKQYKSILIHPGDSLWSIASDYMDGHYSSTQEYIRELKFINNLESDLIYADEYLLVPYYVN